MERVPQFHTNDTSNKAPSRESTDNNEKHPVEQQPPKAEKLVRLEIASLEQASSSK